MNCTACDFIEFWLFQVVTENMPWKGGLVAVNAFGVGNLFTHCILKSHPKDKLPPPPPGPETVPRLICLSARHEEGLKSIMEQVRAIFHITSMFSAFNSILNRIMNCVKVDSRPVDHDYARLLHDVFSHHIFGHLYRGYTFMPPLPSQSEMLVSFLSSFFFVRNY